MRVVPLLGAALIAGCVPGDVAPAREVPPPPSRVEAAPQRTPPDRKPRPADEEVEALPAPRPAWEARPVTADAQIVTASTYVVEPDDTLRRIADKLLHQPTVRVKELANETGAVSYAAALAELFSLDPEAVDAVTRPSGEALS